MRPAALSLLWTLLALMPTPHLRESLKALLGYQTYVCFPLELALGHLGPLLAATLYTVLTRLGEAGLEALGAALRQGLGTEATERFLAEVRRFSQAAGVRLVGRDGHRAELGWLPPCGMRDCPAWRGQVAGLKTGLPDCPEAEGRPRICLPFWAHGEVVAVGTLFHARPPKPPTAFAAPVLWLSRLTVPLLFPQEAKEKEAPELEVYALGGFRVRYRGRELGPRDFGRRGAYQLFKFLLANKDRAAYLEELAETFFPELPPERARQEVYTLVYRLRKTLPGIVEREGAYYRLHLPEKRFLDFEHFEALMRRADLEEGLAAFKTLRQALELYKGPLFGDDPYGEWAEAERAYLQERALSGLLRLGGLAEALGYKEAAEEAYARALKLEPFLEEAHNRLLALKE